MLDKAYMKMKLVIIGHSYVRRLTRHMEEHELPMNFNIDAIDNVDWVHRGGMKMEELWDDQRSVPTATLTKVFRDLKPTHVYLEMGTIELARATHHEALNVATAMADCLRWMVNNGVVFIMCGKVLPRLKDRRKIPRAAKLCRGINFAQFDKNRAVLRDVLEATMPEQARLWAHCRIEVRKNLFHKDGLHLNEKGMQRYYYSVRGALLHMANRI